MIYPDAARTAENSREERESRMDAGSCVLRGLAARSLAARSLAARCLSFAAMGVLLPLLSGCQGITEGPVPSQVRMIDASLSAGAIDVYLGSNALAYNLGLGTVTSYVPATPGTYTVSAEAAGTRTTLATAPGVLAANNQYPVVFGAVGGKYQQVLLKDQSQPTPAGQVALRLLDQADRGGAVDLYLISSGSTMTGASPTLTNVTFGENTGYFTMPAGRYSLVMLPTGTTPAVNGTTSYTGAAVVYASGSAKTLVLLNTALVGTPGLQVVSANDYDPIAMTD
jgi:hypothetical protein